MPDDRAADDGAETFKLVLLVKAPPDRRRAEIRLRLLLKDLLRGYGLKCLSVEAQPEAPSPPQ
jgi:hypothetical protein